MGDQKYYSYKHRAGEHHEFWAGHSLTSDDPEQKRDTQPQHQDVRRDQSKNGKTRVAVKQGEPDRLRTSRPSQYSQLPRNSTRKQQSERRDAPPNHIHPLGQIPFVSRLGCLALHAGSVRPTHRLFHMYELPERSEAAHAFGPGRGPQRAKLVGVESVRSQPESSGSRGGEAGL